MKREFLKELGLEKEIVEKVMTEYGKDVETYKAKAESVKTEIAAKDTEIESLKTQLQEANTAIDGFKALLSGLSEQRVLSKKIQLRTADLSGCKGKERVQIPVRYTLEELMAIEEFEK